MASPDNLDDRYARNAPTITPDEQRTLARKRVCVCGCGGLGGTVVELLARLGVGTIVAIDDDSFETTNLNRQLLAREDNLGQSKALAAKERVAAINSSVTVVACTERIDEGNAPALLDECDVVVDALDSRNTRLLLERWCAEANVPLVHGAVASWYAQAGVIAPGSNALEKVYPDGQREERAAHPSVPSFTAAFCAAIQAAECAKVLLGRDDALYGKLLVVDMQRNTQRVIQL